MKKFITWAIALWLCVCQGLFPVQFKAVSAQNSPTVPELSAGGYACVLTDDTYFYSVQDEKSGLFLLPKTYFVKVIKVGEEYCQIEYLYDDAKVKKLTGYARSRQLTAVDFVPKRPYYYRLFSVSYRLDGAIAGDAFLDEITISCTYYGDFIVGSKTYCYVLQGETFGYVPKPADFTVEPSNEYAEYYTPQETPTQPIESTDSNPAQIAILVALCLLVPILAALIIKPPRRPPYETDG